MTHPWERPPEYCNSTVAATAKDREGETEDRRNQGRRGRKKKVRAWVRVWHKGKVSLQSKRRRRFSLADKYYRAQATRLPCLLGSLFKGAVAVGISRTCSFHITAPKFHRRFTIPGTLSAFFAPLGWWWWSFLQDLLSPFRSTLPFPTDRTSYIPLAVVRVKHPKGFANPSRCTILG